MDGGSTPGRHRQRRSGPRLRERSGDRPAGPSRPSTPRLARISSDGLNERQSARTSSATPWRCLGERRSRGRTPAGSPLATPTRGGLSERRLYGASWQRLEESLQQSTSSRRCLSRGREFGPALSCMMPRWSKGSAALAMEAPAHPVTGGLRRREDCSVAVVLEPDRIPPRCSLRTDTPLPDVGRRRQLECGRHGFRTLILRGDLVGRLCRSRRLVGRFVSHRRRRPDLDAHGPRISS